MHSVKLQSGHWGKRDGVTVFSLSGCNCDTVLAIGM